MNPNSDYYGKVSDAPGFTHDESAYTEKASRAAHGLKMPEAKPRTVHTAVDSLAMAIDALGQDVDQLANKLMPVLHHRNPNKRSTGDDVPSEGFDGDSQLQGYLNKQWENLNKLIDVVQDLNNRIDL